MVAGLNLDRLGTVELSWLDLAVFIRYAPRSSAIYREVNGDDTEWGLKEHLLATAVDVLNMANWQRQQDKHAPKPKPINRPGLSRDGKVGSGAIPMSEFKTWWDNN